ncbi:MAG: sulfotransferase [Actinomycetota bacterium]|nr:sulfotransferase [Actinomycetota bacterium]
MARNPYVFVVGCGRSGTTLLQRMLDAHPCLAVTNEMDIGLKGFGHNHIRRWRNQIGLTHDGSVTATFVESLFDNWMFTRLSFDSAAVRQIANARARVSYRDFVSRLFDLYAEMRGKELAGDKTPWYVRRIWGLHQLWPDARFIHIMRDGRDVYQSMRSWRQANATSSGQGGAPDGPARLKDDPQGDVRYGDYLMSRFKTWEVDAVVTLALWWKWTVLLGRQDGRMLGSNRYQEVLYEDLVGDPVRTSKTVCAFLEIPFSMEMIKFANGKTRADPRLSSKDRWLPPTPGLRDWRIEMSEDEMKRFEAVAGDLLRELGYERGATKIPSATIEITDSVAEMFVQDLRDKRAIVPTGLYGG